MMVMDLTKMYLVGYSCRNCGYAMSVYVLKGTEAPSFCRCPNCEASNAPRVASPSFGGEVYVLVRVCLGGGKLERYVPNRYAEDDIDIGKGKGYNS